MAAEPRYRITLTKAQLELLDDAIGYYRLSDMGGDADNDDPESRRLLRDIEHRIAYHRDRIEAKELDEYKAELRAAGMGETVDAIDARHEAEAT